MHPPAPFRPLASERLILSGGSSKRDRCLSALAARDRVDLDVAWEVGLAEAQIKAVKTNLGIALVPYHAVATDLARGILACLSVQEFPIRTNWYLIWQTGRLSPLAQAFRDCILDHRAEIQDAVRVP